MRDETAARVAGMARDHHPHGAQGRPGRHRRRRPGQHGPDRRQGQRAQGAPPRQGRGHRRLRRRDRRRLHPVRAARGQARAISRPARARLRRTGQGLAHRPLSAPPRGDAARRRQGRRASRSRAQATCWSPRATKRLGHGDRLGRQLRARRRPRAPADGARRRGDRAPLDGASPPTSASTPTTI